MGYLPIKIKSIAKYWLCHVLEVVIGKIKCFQSGFLSKDTHNTSWLAPHNNILPLNLSSSPTNQECHNWSIAILTMKDGGYSLNYGKVTYPKYQGGD